MPDTHEEGQNDPRNDPLFDYEWAKGAARYGIEENGYPYTFERVGTEHGIAWRLTWWTPNLTESEAERVLRREDEPWTWDEALADL